MAAPTIADLPTQTITALAGTYSIPPAVLQAVLQQADHGPGNTVAGLPRSQLSAMGVDPSVQNDPMVIAETAAARLQQSFNQYGDWQQALSAYLTGNPNDYQSPTSAVGGQIWGILGAAASDPTVGMAGYTAGNPTLFGAAANGFTSILQNVHSAGGVVTQGHIDNWHETSQVAAGKFGNPAVAQGLQAAAKNNGQDYSFGQCTYYVARSLGWVPGGLGNAADWAHNAADKGFNVNHTPTVGSAVVYGAGGNYSPAYGHVAVVKSVNADGTFTVSEMNVQGNDVADTRVSTMGGVIGFIQPPAGTDMKTAAPGLASTVTASAKPAQPGASTQQSALGIADAPKPAGPSPNDVRQFAEHLQGAGIDPNDFAANFPAFAASRRRLTQQNSSPQDYAQAVADLHQQGLPVTQQNINGYLGAQPHPTYPDVTVAAFHSAYAQATLHSVTALGRTPYPSEVARLAGSGAGWEQTKGFYGALATDMPGDTQPTAQPQQQGAPPKPGQQQKSSGALQ